MSDLFSNNDLEDLYSAHGIRQLPAGSFNCPHCQTKKAAFTAYRQTAFSTDDIYYQLVTVECSICHKTSVYAEQKHDYIETPDPDDPMNSFRRFDYLDKLIYPQALPVDVPQPNKDMPEDVTNIYIEAAKTMPVSPRSSVALLRLALQQLVDEFVNGHDNLDKKIGRLVSDGLPKRIQQMLDSIRVIGNNAVHPGQINFDDSENSSNIALALFSMINAIVQFEITDKNTLDTIYSMIPDGQKQHIEQRDSH